MPTNTHLKLYLDLINRFLANSIDVQSFEHQYLQAFKAETQQLSEPVFRILNHLFVMVDAFCPDESLQDEDDIDEIQLRHEASKAAQELRKPL